MDEELVVHVEEIPTGYIFTKYSGQSEGKQGNILIHKTACEIIQKNRKNRRDTSGGQ